MKTSELTGAALDWAVAKAEGLDPMSTWLWATGCFVGNPPNRFEPSTDWAQGGPVIDKMRSEAKHLCFVSVGQSDGVFCSVIVGDPLNNKARPCRASDPLLVLMMRAYVIWKLGDEVDVPKELL